MATMLYPGMEAHKDSIADSITRRQRSISIILGGKGLCIDLGLVSYLSVPASQRAIYS